ncbi:MAG: AMP-binding protein [Acidobacteriota bacterium]|nr:MAG: AMP-binding protein [Acidobacteriota bacterium]
MNSAGMMHLRVGPSTIAGLVGDQAAECGDRTAIMAAGMAPLDYSGVAALVGRTRAALREFGIGSGDIVALALPNGPEMATGFLALASAAICAPLNPLLREKNHLEYLGDLRAKAVLAGDGMEEVELAAGQLGIPVLKVIPERRLGAGCFTVRPASRGFDCSPAQPEDPVSEDIALILPTSGTTSKPKLVPLSHRNLCASARNIGVTLGLGPSDRCLNMMPLFHIHGLIAALLSTCASGGSIICTQGFSASHFPSWLAEFEPTWYSAVPTIHQSVLGCADRIRDFRSLRFVRSSSASLPPKVMADLEELFDSPVIEAYGMTEAAHQMASNPLGRQKPGKVGLPAGPEIMVVDESGRTLPTGSTGEIVIRGENVTRGYLHNDAANLEAFRDGWFRTGDQGFFDEDGYLCLTGRTKELINRGGEKIAPREIEEALLEHPAVSQAVSFSIPHPTLGEDVAAAVVLKPGCSTDQDELGRFAAQRLSHFKVPRIIRFVPEIPKGPTGKLQRIGLAETLGIRATENERREFIPPAGPLEEQIAEIWRETLKLESIGAGDDFFLLGGDSLLAVEVVTRVSARIVDIQHVSIYENPRLRDFAHAVQSELEDPKQIDSSSIVPIRVTGDRPPLFCLPGHENKFGIFCRLARFLGTDQPVYGLSYPGLSSEKDHYRLNELADDLISRMREIRPHGPFRLFGHCFGGYIAFEMARRLGSPEVEFLFLMDSYLPAPLKHPACPTGGGHRLEFHLRALEERRGLQKPAYLAARLRATLDEILIRGGNVIYTFFARRGRPIPAFLRRRDIASRFTVGEYRPAAYDGDVRLIRMEDQRSEAGLMGWEGWLRGETKLLRVPFDESGIHSNESVAIIGPRIAAILESGIDNEENHEPSI